MHILARFNKQKWNVKLYLENTKISSPKLSTVILLTTKLQKQFFFLSTLPGESKIGIKMFRLKEKLNLNEVKCSLKFLMCNISRIHSIWTVTQEKKPNSSTEIFKQKWFSGVNLHFLILLCEIQYLFCLSETFSPFDQETEHWYLTEESLWILLTLSFQKHKTVFVCKQSYSRQFWNSMKHLTPW